VYASGQAQQLYTQLSAASRADYVVVSQPKRFAAPSDRRLPRFMKEAMCTRPSANAEKFADFACQIGFSAASNDAHQGALRLTPPMIAGRVRPGLVGEVLQLTYATFIHVQN
jgi:hypothetical protein